MAEGLLLADKKKRVKLQHHIDAVTGAAEKMIEKLLEHDSKFFTEFRYDNDTKQMKPAKLSIDKLL